MKKILFACTCLLALNFANLAVAEPKSLTNEMAFAYFVGQKPNRADFYPEFLYAFAKEKYWEVHNDEFEFRDLLDATGKNISQLASEVSTDQEYYMWARSRMGDYDFDNLHFAFEPIKVNDAFSLHDGARGCGKCKTSTPLALMFTNAPQFKNLPLDRTAANAFVRSRRTSYGLVDREVYIKVLFKIKGFGEWKNEEYEEKSEVQRMVALLEGEVERRDALRVEIMSIEVYDGAKLLGVVNKN